jgi:hypothetical protein
MYQLLLHQSPGWQVFTIAVGVVALLTIAGALREVSLTLSQKLVRKGDWE